MVPAAAGPAGNVTYRAATLGERLASRNVLAGLAADRSRSDDTNSDIQRASQMAPRWCDAGLSSGMPIDPRF